MKGISLTQILDPTPSQKFILTQHLKLFLNLVQMTTVELREYIEEQLIENPALEEDLASESVNEEDIIEQLLANLPDNGRHDYLNSEEFTNAALYDEPTWEEKVGQRNSLFEYLHWQLSMTDMSNQEKEIASLIIGNTNEDGYLETEFEEIVEMLSPKRNESVQKVAEIAKRIRTTFDPVGVCSRTLSECLCTQALDLGYERKSPFVQILKNHIDDLGRKDYAKICKECGIDAEQMTEIEAMVTSLEPMPGRPFFTEAMTQTIVPDFYVYKVGDQFQTQSNRSFPKLRVSSYCRKFFKDRANLNKETTNYLREKIEAAQRIIQCIEEREETVHKVIEKIVDEQTEFFNHGSAYINPLRLKDVADALGIHESTVSRITSRKYIQCPQGVIELKKLFSRSVRSSNGKKFSLERVKLMIKEIVNEEPKHCTFSDEDISKILLMKNVKVARRTVAKYRKQLGIPSSSKRLSKEV